jgi:hypothetical protein
MASTTENCEPPLLKNPILWAKLLKIAPLVLIGGLSIFILVYWTHISTWAFYNLVNSLISTDIVAIIGIVVGLGIIFAFFFFLGTILQRKGDIFTHIRQPKLKKLTKGVFALLTLALIVSGVGLLALGLYKWEYRFYTIGPYLTLANDQEPHDSITVCWRTATWTGSEVRYGLAKENLDKTASSEGIGYSHFVALKNLQPNTVYYYEVVGQNFGMKQFRTAPGPGQNATFTFVVWADPRTNNWFGDAINGPNLPSYMINDLKKSSTDLAFSIVCGDVADNGQGFDLWKLFLEDITTDDFASNAFNIDALGNHEHHGDPQLHNFRDYYPYEQGNFSFVYGQLYVLVLDTFDYENGEWVGVNFPQAQFEWAKADLAAHSHIPFKIIAMHQSPIYHGNFVTGGHHGNISTELLYLCSTYGVDALFCGHSHHYEVSYLDGTHFIMAGIGGNKNRGDWQYDGLTNDVTKAGGEILAWGGKDTGWLRIDMTPDQMHIRPIMIDGTEYPGFLLNATDNIDL